MLIEYFETLGSIEDKRMKNQFILIIVTLFFSCSGEKSTTSETEQKEIAVINQVDSAGLKQGIWIKEIGSNIIDSMNYVNDRLNGIYKSYFKFGGLRHIGKFREGTKTGQWKYYDKGILVAEEIDWGPNRDSVRHELGYYLTPKFFSYVKFYNRKNGNLEEEGKVLHSDGWQSDTSREQGIWVYYDENGDTIKIKTFEYGQVTEQNTP